MDTLFTIMSLAFLIGVCVFILPFFGEMLFEAIGLLIERIEYGKKKEVDKLSAF